MIFTFLKDYYSIDDALQDLQEKYHIDHVKHEDLIILDYNMAANKHDEMVRQCRSLVINDKKEYVASSFRRFFNLGECPEEDSKFDWNCRAYEKADGSLITVYYYNGWRINTRASFGYGEINKSGHTWNSLVSSLLDFDKLNPNLTYIFELCSPYNQVIRYYDKPQVQLLSVNNRGYEYDHDKLELIAQRAGLTLVNSTLITSLDEAKGYIEKQVELDRRFEGVVLKSNIRLKLKSEFYVKLHYSWSNLSNDNKLIDMFLEGNRSEAETYFPEWKDKFDRIEQRFNEIGQEADELYDKYKHFPVQKDFALAVLGSRYSSILFQARKLGKKPSELKSLCRKYL